MKHPTPEQLKPLLNAVDVACWAIAVKQHTRKGTKCRVDWKSSLVDLQEAWRMFQLVTDDKIAIISEAKP